MKGNKGFTLIELIIVIVILGILGALIVPRFAALDSEARKAAVNGLEGALRSAAAIAHSMSLAQAQGGAASVTLEGTTVTMINFYPTANAAGIGEAIGGTSGYSGFTTSGGGATNGATLTFTKTGAATAATCIATYTAAAATDGAAPTFAKNTGGC